MSDGYGYLIWSHEHGAWWGPGRSGYVQRVSEAGWYTREEAIRICAAAMPGTSNRLKAPPQLPIALADINAMIAINGRAAEAWT